MAGDSYFADSMYSKSYYLKQVHQPRHLHESARLFGPDFLEVRLSNLFLSTVNNVYTRCSLGPSGT